MNIKPDDKLAFIVNSVVPGNNGLIVEIVRFAGGGNIYFGGFFYEGEATCWICRSTGSPLGAVGAEDGRIDYVSERPIRDDCLRPIRDMPGDETFVTETRKSLPTIEPVTA